MNPNSCDNGSLVYAKNMKIGDDGCLTNDYGYNNIPGLEKYNVVGHIVGLDNKVYFFTSNTHKEASEEEVVVETEPNIVVTEGTYYSLKFKPISFFNLIKGYGTYYFSLCIKVNDERVTDTNRNYTISQYGISGDNLDVNYFSFKVLYRNVLDPIQDFFDQFVYNIEHILEEFSQPISANSTYEINKGSDVAGSALNHIIYFNDKVEITMGLMVQENATTNTAFYYQTSLSNYTENEDDNTVMVVTVPVYKTSNIILEYDELTKEFREIPCGWRYTNGKIKGCVTTNISGEKILTIAEENPVYYVQEEAKFDEYNGILNTQISLANSIPPSQHIVEDAIITELNGEPVKDTEISIKPQESQSISVPKYTKISAVKNTQIINRTVNGTTVREQLDTTPQTSVTKYDIIDTQIATEFVRKAIGTFVPIKHINLNYCTYLDDETIYSQAPKVPITNLNLEATYAKTIPNGVYVFYIRYQIREDVYTDWHLCSKPIFAGISEDVSTIQGGLRYINLHKDSAKSFVFSVDHVNGEAKKLYKKFQLGFIISHDEAVDARTWKTFDIETTNVYFDYDEIEEANIDDLTKTTYEIYNVGNVSSFKNKLYISNYIESDFNPTDTVELAKQITIGVDKNNTVVQTHQLKVGDKSLKWNSTKNYYDSTSTGGSLKSCIEESILDISVGNASKVDNASKGTGILPKTHNKIFELVGEWHGKQNPDLFAITSLNSNIIGNTKLFGTNFNYNYAALDGKVGVEYLGKSQGNSYNGGLWFFVPSMANPHPFYNLGLTIGFGMLRGSDDAKDIVNGVLPFNQATLQRGFISSKVPDTLAWVTRDENFDNDSSKRRIQTYIKEEITSRSAYIEGYCFVTYGGKYYKIGYSPEFDNSNFIINLNDSGKIDKNKNEIKVAIKNKIVEAIKNNICGINESGHIILKLGDKEIEVNNIGVIYKEYNFVCDDPNESEDGNNYTLTWTPNLETTDYHYNCTISFKNGIIESSSDDTSFVHQDSTLMPFSKYKVYAHFVDEHGIITNGRYIKTIDNVYGINSNIDLINLKYTVGDINTNKYKAFFLSIANVGNKIIETFNYSKDGYNHYLHSIELDSLLYNLNSGIRIIDNMGRIITKNAHYYSSGSYPSEIDNTGLAFGNCGYITWNDSEIDSNYYDANDHPVFDNEVLFIEIENKDEAKTSDKLIKATNYLPLTKTTDKVINNGFYGSYFCLIKKPDFEVSSHLYVSGSDIYAKDNYLNLTEISSTQSITDSPVIPVRSNFNLNYLNLSEDITNQILRIGNDDKRIAKVINSSILSFIYQLNAMYKDFYNHYFRAVTDYARTDFNNTVRVSNVLSDETFNIDVFKFEPNDYYNIPTDRGIIVKMFSISNEILVHTKGSLYKFDANNTIVGEDKDVKLKESNPFDTGITQIFDSQYGYGGIDNEEAGCITFDSYFFYDKFSKHIFGYHGNGQIITIDNNIVEFLRYYKPEFCRTLHDERNNRVLFEFKANNDNNKNINGKDMITISYNYKAKNFISFHDLNLINTFNTRLKCYSYCNKSLLSLFESTNTIDDTSMANSTWKIFGDATKTCIIKCVPQQYIPEKSPFQIDIIMFTKETFREIINTVKYYSKYIENNIYINDAKMNYLDTPIVQADNPIIRFYIKTDRCLSNIIDTTIDDTERPNSLMDYKGFKFDLGSWNANYFRNVYNDANVYEYPDQKGIGRNLVSDNNSLMYGRYFILHFEFNKEIPSIFEDIFINTQQY